jgi:ABC-type multidrug transport system permease subunit
MIREAEAFTIRQFMEQVRSPANLFWTVVWPIFWLLLGFYIFLAGIPEAGVAHARGSMTIQMVAFGLATLGMVSLAGSIAADREGGLYLKLSSMPISASGEMLGRLLGSLIFGLMAAAAITAIGIGLGSKFEAGLSDAVKAAPFFITLLLSAAGIGMTIANLVKRANAVTGIGITLLVAGSAVSGIFTPYPFLPETLKTFSRLYPVSSSMHVIKRILLPSEFNTMRYGFDPLESHYIAYAIMASIATLATGLIIHSAARIRRARTL